MALKKPIVVETTLADALSNFQGADTLDIDGSLVVNESGGDKDTRIEGDTATNLVLVDASLDAFQIGTTVAGAILDARAASVVINEVGADRDTRVEGVSTPLLFEVDASQNSVKIGGSLSGTIAAFLQSGVTFNDETADRDFKIAGDTLVYMFFVDASPTTENIAMLSVSAPNWQSMDRGLFIGDVTTAPIGNPIGGIFVWSGAGELKVRDAGGNVTNLTAITISDTAIITNLGSIDGGTAVNGGLVVNEPGDNIVALRVEGDTATNLLVVRGSNESVSIGTTLETAIALFRPVEITFNEIGADLDFRLEGDTLQFMIATDASALTENIALLADAALPNWQTMDRGIFIGNATTAPTGNPTAGIFLWAEAGELKARDTSGVVTTLTAAAPNIQAFDTLGANTWTKPAGAVTVEVHLIGGGGGGGSGRKGATSTIRAGGGGGGGGGYSFGSFAAGTLGATETVTIGARGARGANQATDDSDGNAGAAGGNTTFGVHLTAGGGAGGGGGTSAAGGAGGAGGTATGGEAGGSGSAGTTGTGNANPGGATTGLMAGGGGGGGGGINASNVVGNGESGGNSGGTGGSRGFGTATEAIVSGENATPGPAYIAGTTPKAFGGGGGGGAVTSTGTAIQTGLGGTAGIYGGGGAGGSGTTNTVNHFNAGGFGAQGVAIVITHFS